MSQLNSETHLPHGNSTSIFSNQIDIHPDLSSIITKHMAHPDQRPISDEQKKQFEFAWNWQQNHPLNSFILDTGCGTGQSSQQLAKLFPDSCIIGIDQSMQRLGNAVEKCSEQANLLLIQARMEEFWLQCLEAKWAPTKQYFLYPNPWPKKKHFQRRWHGHSIFPILLQVCSNLELRTNWEIYAKEFSVALDLAGHLAKLEQIFPHDPLTPFEHKYQLSGHHLYQVTTTSR